MNNREKVAVNFDGNLFEFYVDSNVVEKQKIKMFAAEYLGGMDKYAKLESMAEMAYLDHIKYCQKTLGNEVFLQKQHRLTLVGKEKDKEEFKEEFDKLFAEIYANPYYFQFLNLSREETLVTDYAWLKVMCTNKPDGYEFDKQKEETLKSLLKEVKTKLKFFREQAEKTKEANKA